MADEEAAAEGSRSPHRRRLWWAGAAAAVVALGIAGLALGVDGGPAGQETGSSRRKAGPAAAIELPRLNGEGTVTLTSFRGRPVVVNFFASWCVPCRKEMPAFQAVADELKDKVAFLGVNHNDDREGGLRLLSDTGVRYPTGYDPEGKVAETYGLFGMPTTLFIGADGALLDTHTGELTRGQLEENISRLFGV